MSYVKRILSLILALMMVIGMLPAASASEVIASGTCGDSLFWSVANNILSITGSGDMYDYGSGLENDDGEIEAPAPWDEFCDEIHTIRMDDGITSIGDYAFMFMENLTEIELPSSLTSIGSYSLYWLPITEIRIPEGVVDIGEYGLGHCHYLTEVYFPSTLRSVGKAAFYENYSIERVHIPDLESWFQIQFTSFFSTPFSKYTDTLLYVDGVPVTDIVVPESITVIGEGQFDLYSSMTSLQLHDNITSIGAYAFDCDRGAIQMTQLIIPESVEYIGDGAFRYWSHLSDIYIMNPTCELGDDICFESNCYYDEELNEMIWGMTTIHGYAGSTAEAHAQEYNYPFIELTSSSDVPEGLSYYNCTNYIEISSYTGTESVLEIPKTIEGLPVTSIGYFFNNCPTVTQVILPDTIENINPNAFTGFPKLDSICFSGSCPSYTALDGVLYNGDMTELIKYPSAKKGSFTVPDSVTYIENKAFRHSTGLTALTLPKNYTARLDHGMFSSCVNLKEITIPAGVTEIRVLAFDGCTSLNSIKVDEGNRAYSSIDGVLFNKEGTVLEIFPGGISGHYVIPENVTIAARAFNTENHLTKLTISNNVGFKINFVGADAWGYILHGCTDLTEIKVSADNADYSVMNGILYNKDGTRLIYCPQGKVGIIDVPKNVTSIDYGSFLECGKLTGLVLPKSLSEISSAFNSRNPLVIYYAGTEAEWNAVTISDGPIGDVDSDNYDHGDNYAVLHADVHYNVTNFDDNPISAWYAEPVLWAVSSGITAGASANSFNPNGSCLRAQVVTFLWRAAKQPEPAITTSRFTDVKPTDFFFKPVLWAVEKNITSGVSATEFGSYSNCNRAAVVTFLWRAAGMPEPVSTNNPFTDVKSTDFFYKPVLWAVENGITAGLTATTFGPTAECNRAQVVTFLYRAYN